MQQSAFFSSAVVALTSLLLPLGKQALQRPACVALGEIGEVIVMGCYVNEPLPLDVGACADVIAGGQHEFLIEHPA
jgi:hypothetical protein